MTIPLPANLRKGMEFKCDRLEILPRTPVDDVGVRNALAALKAAKPKYVPSVTE